MILAVSTSSPRGTVALVDGERVLARVVYDGGTAHAERLFAAIDDAMAQAGAERSDLHAVACDVGPGSFTGVRVGVCACQGIAVALGLPAIGVGSLEAMAGAARDGAVGATVVAVLDARKGEVFAAIVAADGGGLWGPVHLPRDEAAAAIASARATRAPGAVVVGEVVTTLDGLGDPQRGEALDLPDAVLVGRLAAGRLGAAAPGSLDAALLEPLYVRAPDARPMATAPSREGPV